MRCAHREIAISDAVVPPEGPHCLAVAVAVDDGAPDPDEGAEGADAREAEVEEDRPKLHLLVVFVRVHARHRHGVSPALCVRPPVPHAPRGRATTVRVSCPHPPCRQPRVRVSTPSPPPPPSVASRMAAQSPTAAPPSPAVPDPKSPEVQPQASPAPEAPAAPTTPDPLLASLAKTLAASPVSPRYVHLADPMKLTAPSRLDILHQSYDPQVLVRLSLLSCPSRSLPRALSPQTSPTSMRPSWTRWSATHRLARRMSPTSSPHFVHRSTLCARRPTCLALMHRADQLALDLTARGLPDGGGQPQERSAPLCGRVA